MKRQNPLIIGLTGLPGSGKTTTAKMLAKKKFINIVLSDFIKTELKKSGKKVTRKSLQDFGDKLRKEKGSDILAEMALRKIKSKKIKKAIIDGIRNLTELNRLKEEPNFFLFGLSALPKKRYDRLMKMLDKRGKNKIESYEDFVKRDLREDRGLKNKTGQQNRLCFLYSDYFIDNNTGFKGLQKKIEKALKDIKNKIKNRKDKSADR